MGEVMCRQCKQSEYECGLPLEQAERNCRYGGDCDRVEGEQRGESDGVVECPVLYF